MVEHNEQNTCLPDNSQKKRRPKDLPQRIVFADTTFPALCTQMKEAQGKFCFLEAKEIEDLYNLQSGRGGKSPLVILREADDPDGRIRQRRVGEKSVTVDMCPYDSTMSYQPRLPEHKISTRRIRLKVDCREQR
jgi:hypothetical protein